MSASPISPSAADAIEQLRCDHQVRELRPDEEGSAIARLPNGTYGFSYAPGQSEVPVFSKKNYHCFEIHKAVDGIGYVIGFVTAEQASDLAARKEGAAIVLFPNPFETAQTLACVNASQIAATKRMPREAGNPFPFAIA